MIAITVCGQEATESRPGNRWIEREESCLHLPTKIDMQESFAEENSGYRILLVAGTHGLEPTQARSTRVRTLAKELACRGARVDVLLLVEKPLRAHEEAQITSLRGSCHALQLFYHPVFSSSVYRAWLQTEELINEKIMRRSQPPGRTRHCPQQFLRLLQNDYVPRSYVAVMTFGVHLARCLGCFNRWTLKVLDLPYVANARHEAHRQHGREDILTEFAAPEVEMDLFKQAHFISVQSSADAAQLRQASYLGDLIHVPISCDEEQNRWRINAGRVAQTRPQRILTIASDTIANLDGLRWFRRQVFPKIVQSVPTCRLRIVGEAARHIEAGDRIDRIGWLDRLEEEYEHATLVALPLRMGSGVRRRAVETLTAGRTLVTTEVGARGLELSPMRDAIVLDNPDALARQTVEVLTDESKRLVYQQRGRMIAERYHCPERSIASLCRVLGLPLMRCATLQPEPTVV